MGLRRAARVTAGSSFSSALLTAMMAACTGRGERKGEGGGVEGGGGRGVVMQVNVLQGLDSQCSYQLWTVLIA